MSDHVLDAIDLVEHRALDVARWFMIAAAMSLAWIYVIAIIGGMLLDERDRRRHAAVLARTA